MTAQSTGGPAKRVRVIAASDLKQNGGGYVLEGRIPLAVYGVSEGETIAQGGQFPVEGNISAAVYIVETPDGVVTGNVPVPMIAVEGGLVAGNTAIPVYVVGGSLGGLDPVTNLELTVTGANRELITATYDAVAGATDYEYEYSPDGVTYMPIGTTALLTFDLDDTEYDIGIETHYVRVRAVGGDDWTIATLDDLAIGLVAGWTMHGASGTNETDVTGNGNTAADVGTVGSIVGVLGDARTPAASGNRYFEIADSADVSMGAGVRFSIVALVKCTNFGAGVQTIIAQRDGGGDIAYWMRFLDSGTLNVAVSSDGTIPNITSLSHSASLSNDTWYLTAMIYNGSTLGVSLDGQAPETTAYSADVYDSPRNVQIGAFVGGATPNEVLTGVVQQVLIYKRALSATNLTRLDNGGAYLDITTVLP